MIKHLRKKFVIVTMLLMTVTLGLLFTINKLTINYWDEQELLYRLEWYADSDSFFEFDPFEGDSLDEYNNPIFAIELDRQLNILSIQSSSKTNRQAPSEDVIRAVFSQSPEQHKWKSYIYIIKDHNAPAYDSSDSYMLIITDTSEGKAGIYRNLGNLLLICIGLFVLFFISLFLSRFVIQPAQNALEREKQFISDASHELKTPLAAISINAQALKADMENNRHLQNILSETKRMEALIQKLLRLSYIEEVGSNIEKTSFSLSQCCEEIVLSMESIIYERKISLDYDIQENITYHGNENDLKQVFAILLDNAMKYTPEHGTIYFQLKQENFHITIVVKNNGQGISPEDLPHIFERFYQADKSRNAGQSTECEPINDSSDTDNRNSYGLGLAIAKAILDAHNASITVESEQEKGVQFTITLA